MTNDDKLIAILKAQSMAINNLVDAVNKLGELQDVTWNIGTSRWELIDGGFKIIPNDTKEVSNG